MECKIRYIAFKFEINGFYLTIWLEWLHHSEGLLRLYCENKIWTFEGWHNAAWLIFPGLGKEFKW